MGTGGFQEEARSTATELERCRQERSQENGHQLGRLKRLRRTGGAGGIVSPNASLTRDEPGTSNYGNFRLSCAQPTGIKILPKIN